MKNRSDCKNNVTGIYNLIRLKDYRMIQSITFKLKIGHTLSSSYSKHYKTIVV